MIHHYVVDYNKSTKINNIEYSSIEPVNTFTKKIKFFNPEISEPLHRFWYFVPNAKLIKKNVGMITLVLSSTDTNIIESIKNLDEKTGNILKKINQSIKILPSIKISPNFPPVLEIYVDDDSKYYDQDNKSIVYMNIKNNSKIQLYIEFESVTFGSNRCERRWRIIQLKENKSLDLNTNMFDMIYQEHTHGHIPLNLGNPSMFYAPSHAPSHAPAHAPSQTSYGIQQYNPYYVPYGQSVGFPPSSLMGPPSPPLTPPLSTKPYPILSQRDENPTICGASFQPPTQDQLLSMLEKLKKPTKPIDLNKTNNSNQSTLTMDNIKKSIHVSHEHIIVSNINKEIKNAHIQENNTGTHEEYRQDFLKKIFFLIEEHKSRLERDTILFNKDVDIAKKIMQRIDAFIQKRTIFIKHKEYDKSINIKSNAKDNGSTLFTAMIHINNKKNQETEDSESDDDDPFAISIIKKAVSKFVQSNSNAKHF